MSELIVYSKEDCNYCIKAKEFLNNNNIPVPPALQHYPPKYSTSKHCCSELQKPPSYADFINRIKCA